MTRSATPSHGTSRWHTRSCTRRGSPTTPCSNPYVARGGGVRGQRAVGLWSRRRARLHASRRRNHHQNNPRCHGTSASKHHVESPRAYTCLFIHTLRAFPRPPTPGPRFSRQRRRRRGGVGKRGKNGMWARANRTFGSLSSYLLRRRRPARCRHVGCNLVASFTLVLPQPMTDGLLPAGTTLRIDATANTDRHEDGRQAVSRRPEQETRFQPMTDDEVPRRFRTSESVLTCCE